MPQVRDILKDLEARMKKSVEALREELIKIRTGKATTTLLDGIKIDYYGTPTPLNQVGNVSVHDVHMLTVQPWEKNLIPAIEKAILAANIGLNPLNDGAIIKIPIPSLNEERRKELVRLAKKFSEEGKVAVRNIRRDAIEQLKKSEKEEHFSEDDRKRGEQETQKLTDKYIKEIESLLLQREKEIMEV